MSTPPDPLAGADPAEGSLEGPGSLIGPYKLLKQIGEGGFGTVFLAEREHPIRRRVALKILKPGMDTRQVVARFEAERQALALMDHPGIARVYDAGATAAGRPYFAMELVKGLPIQEYCDTQRLSTRERLALFVEVCRAVQHAHQKGIIHRDLKPSNVLVALQDGRPVPKVIDFGIAKALEQKLTDKTLFTEFRQMMGTPAYMSPEQADVSGLDVDTRSDIYSLGVILYELLTGVLPFSVARLQQAGYAEILRIIREEQPSKPSTKVSTLGGTLPAVAACRRTEPRKLGALMRGELDWIVMKTLEKERARRYETADALAAEVLRFLDDEPVEAGAPSRVYRARMFVRRHRVGVLASAALILMLGLGLAGTSIGLLRASHASARARQHTIDAERQFELASRGAELLHHALMQDFQMVAGTRDLQLKLLGTVLGYNERLAAEKVNDPRQKSRFRSMYWALGRTYLDLGDVSRASEACRRYQDLVNVLPSEEPQSLAATYEPACAFQLQGMIALHVGHGATALAAYQRALATLGDESRWESYDIRIKTGIALMHHGVAAASEKLGDFAAARASYSESIDLYERLSRAGDQDWENRLSQGQAELGLAELALWDEEDLEKAGPHFERAQAIVGQLLGRLPNAPRVVTLEARLLGARSYWFQRMGDGEQAWACVQEALSQVRRIAAEEPEDPTILLQFCEACRMALPLALARGNLKPAKALSEEFLTVARALTRSYGENLSYASELLLALTLAEQIAEQEADTPTRKRLLDEVLPIAERIDAQLPDDINSLPMLIKVHEKLGNLAREQGDRQAEAQHFTTWAELADRMAAGAPRRRSLLQSQPAAHSALGLLAFEERKLNEATKHYRIALECSEKLAHDEPTNPLFASDVAILHGNLADCAQQAGNTTVAIEQYGAKLGKLEALRAAEPRAWKVRFELAATCNRLVDVECRTGMFAEGRAHAAHALELAEVLIRDLPGDPRLRLLRADAYLLLGTLELEAQRFEVACAALEHADALSRELAADYPDHIGYLSTAASACNFLSRAHRLLAHGVEARNWTVQAIDLLRKLAAAPSADSATYANECALLLVTCEPADLRDPAAAVVLALQCVARSGGQDPAFLDTLAMAYSAAGDQQKATETQELALMALDASPSPRRERFEERLAQYRAAKEQNK